MRKTAWIPFTTKPTRAGVYLCRNIGQLDTWWRAYDGTLWHYGIRATFPTGQFAEKSPSYYFAKTLNWPPVLDDFEWRGLQGDEHSLEIGASTYLVEFGDEGRDRPGDDE